MSNDFWVDVVRLAGTLLGTGLVVLLVLRAAFHFGVRMNGNDDQQSPPQTESSEQQDTRGEGVGAGALFMVALVIAVVVAAAWALITFAPTAWNLAAYQIPIWIAAGGAAALTALALTSFSWKKTAMWLVGVVTVASVMWVIGVPELIVDSEQISAPQEGAEQRLAIESKTKQQVMKAWTWVDGVRQRASEITRDLAANATDYEWVLFILGGLALMVMWREVGDKLDFGEILVRAVLLLLAYALAVFLGGDSVDQRIMWFIVAIACIRVWHLAGLFGTLAIAAVFNIIF